MITPERQRILDAMSVVDMAYTPHELSQLTGLPYDSVRLIVRKMEHTGLLTRIGYGQYVKAVSSIQRETVQ